VFEGNKGIMNMAYDYKIEDKQQYIRVEISGMRRPGKQVKDIVPIWSEVTQTCKEKNIHKLLAILKLTGDVSVVGSYTIVNSADSFGWHPNLRVALIDLGEEGQNNLFTETVAVNRGYQLKVFRNEQDGLNWLLG
jgi:hypothetical protein